MNVRSDFVQTSKMLILPSDRATFALGHWLGKHLSAGTTLLLLGDLGSGKTTLTKGLGHGLNVAETIDSPTFTLINEYLSGRLPLYHVDLYRLTEADTAALFLETYWEGVEYAPGIMAIEWAERLQHGPPDPLCVQLTYQQPEGRRVTLTPGNATQSTLLEALTPDAILAHEV